jgi:tetratricopeptide (TPR) repeat protein
MTEAKGSEAMITEERRAIAVDATPQEREPDRGRRRSRRALRVVTIGLLAAAIVVAGGLGLFLRGAGARSGSEANGPTADGGALAAGAGAALPADTLSRTIASLQERLRQDPSDAESWAGLGFAYVQQARVTADPTYYPKAEGALRRSLALQPHGNTDAYAGMGSLAAARHDFSAALAWGERARAVNPYNATIRAIIGDALIELGRYPQAFAEFQWMIDLRPDVSTYSRVSYAQELQGAIPAAEHTMEMAYEAAGSAADAAWASYYLGELAWNQGDVAGAEADYLRGTKIDPTFVPNFEGLAKVEAVRGDAAAALRDYASVTQRYPLPQYVLEYGDLAASAGRTDLANQQYALFHAEVQLFASSGVDTNLEVAQFDADHGTDIAAGLSAAKAEYALRQSITVADALGWALHAAGQDREALRYANRSLALGTRSALFFFHRGMIERGLGMRRAARADLSEALRVNSNFSFLWAAPARRALASLGGRP